MLNLRALFLLVALVLSGPLGGVAAQGVPATEVDNTVIVPDVPKDVQFVLGTRTGTPAQNASSIGPQFDHIDILDVTFGEETETEFQIFLRLAALDPSQPNSGFPFRIVYFSYGQLEWLIFVGGCRQFGQGSGQAEVAGCLMYRDNPGAQARQVKTVPATKTDGAYVFTVNKLDIFNEQRLPAQYGQTLTNLYAYASQTYATTSFLPMGATGDPLGSVSAYDRAPDGGFSKIDYVFNRGSGGHGALGLTSPDPIRVSNGEATTIVYLAQAHNIGDTDLKIQVTTEDLRPEWTVRVPPIVNVPAQQTVEFPVVLTMPFSHDHGKTVMFSVHAESIDDAKSFADLPLGVWWTDVPQPSAHHNGELWFHSAPADFGAMPEAVAAAAFPFKSYWLNSIEDDPNPVTTDENAPAFFNDYFFCPFMSGAPSPTTCRTPPNYTASWFFPLSPSLLIGLDFDLAREGQLLANIVASLPATVATLEVELLYCDPGEGSTGRGGGFNRNATACTNFQTILAKGSSTRALTAQQKAEFDVPLIVEPTADYLPFKRGTNIGLRVRLVTDLPQNTIMTEPRPQFEIKSSKLYLPLIEFHDELAAEFAELGALRVTPLDPYERPVNAGRTVLFDFEVENNDDEDQRVLLELEGVNKEWATLIGPSELQLAKGQRVNFTVAIVPPGDALAEERAELVVIAQSLDEPAITGIARMRATIVNDDVPDEAGLIQVADKKGTPGFAAATLLASLAVVAVVQTLSRRRRS